MHLRLRIALPDYNMDDGKRVDCDEIVKRAKRSEGGMELVFFIRWWGVSVHRLDTN
jgi:hypothetical protein